MNTFTRSATIRALAALVVTTALLTLAGCGLVGGRSDEAAMDAVEKQMEYASPSAAPQMAERGAVMADAVDAELSEGGATGMTSAEAAPVDRKVIKTAEVDLEVDDIDGAQKTIIELVDRRNGFIGSLTVTDYDTSREANIVTRIPSDHFREIYDAVRALGKVTRDHIGGQDVTSEYMDLERRIANLQAQEERVREMFNDAKTVEDLLKVEQRLTEVRGQIEQHQGRLRYLKDQVGFSTVTVTLYEPGDAPVEEPEGWKIGYHLRGAWNALIDAFRGLVYGIIWLVVAGAVVWIPLVIVIALIRRWAIRRRARRASGELPPPPTS